MKKKRVIFRVFPFNRLTMPLLLNIWEKGGIDNSFEIIIAENIPELKKGDTVLYSFMTPHLPLIHKEITKLQNKNVIFVGGGAHVTGDIELSEKMGFDILISGEAENSFLAFGKDLIANKIKKSSLKLYLNNGDIDFDSNIPVSKYMKLISPIEITRGCFWKCKYCETGNIPYRCRSIDSIKLYLEELKKRKFKRVGFIAPSSLEYGSSKPGQNKVQKIEELFQISKGFEFDYMDFGIFPSEIRPETFTGNFGSILKKYVSNKHLTFGAQSGSENRLKEIRRGNKTEDIENAAENANFYGFIANLDFILGFPDENRSEREITYRFIEKLKKKYKIRVQFHHFFPLSGSNFQFRFPSFLNEDEKELLVKMNKDGIASAWSLSDEYRVRKYFKWLKSCFPVYYKKFH